ncbi:TetR/AcrR family transcriptional regulator [Paenibacillus methanolicus]|uniref:AcrR family transcriptional regulator n=1 Tax=Paenibacillus methanolicus TaxID=582686 RepID=A0A5S5C410_9BACL|nr:TetR/AcrR family transcriptional regulator [Paenibacillus methanolicus]TYP74064.1 AcrR family transcriptional regulator [Paenibacillus methanolicus]
MNGFERRTMQKKELILTAAWQLFSSRGYAGTAVNDIADAARVSPATVYNYFETKERLHAAAVLRWMEEQVARYEQLLNAPLRFPEKTRALMELEADNLRLLADASRHTRGDGEEALRQSIETFGDGQASRFFSRYLEQGKAEGFIDPALTEEAAKRYYDMFNRELARLLAASADAEEAGSALDEWLKLFFFGLAGPTGSAGNRS